MVPRFGLCCVCLDRDEFLGCEEPDSVHDVDPAGLTLWELLIERPDRFEDYDPFALDEYEDDYLE